MELNLNTAKAILSTYPFNFNSIEKLTLEGLNILFETPKVILKFPNVKYIENEVLAHFLNYKGNNSIILDGLESLSDKQAEILGNVRQPLSLNGLNTLSINAANFLIHREKGTNNTLELNGLKFLEDDVFNILTKSQTPLSLDGILEINEKQANSLVKNHKDYVSLRGISHLSDQTANILAKFKGFLYLDGLLDLSENAVSSLIKFQGRSLSLSKGIRTIFNKSVFITTDQNKCLQLFVLRMETSQDWIFLYAIGYSGGGVYSESFFKYKADDMSNYIIYKANSIPYESWESLYRNDVSLNEQNLDVSTDDQKHISDMLLYTKKEWISYEETIELKNETLKLIKRNIFTSLGWNDGGTRIYHLISRNWNISYQW